MLFLTFGLDLNQYPAFLLKKVLAYELIWFI